MISLEGRGVLTTTTIYVIVLILAKMLSHCFVTHLYIIRLVIQLNQARSIHGLETLVECCLDLHAGINGNDV